MISGKLEAVGFTPFIKNYYHGGVALGYHLALDGFHIFLPEEEMNEAKDYMNEKHEISNFDEIPARLKKDIIQASIITVNPLFVAWLLSPIFHLGFLLAFIVLYVTIGSEPIIIALLKTSSYAIMIAILAHAKYIALPRETTR